MFLEYAQVLAAAFFFGVAAAAPIGPVNTVAIHRGLHARWTHTLACGIGSAIVDGLYFLLALLAGHWLITQVSNPILKVIVASTGAVLLVVLGGAFLVMAIKKVVPLDPDRGRKDIPPTRLLADMGSGALLTVINPAAPVYWLGVAGNWLPHAQEVFRQTSASSVEPNHTAVWLGLMAAGGGLLSWFLVLTAVVRFTPRRIGPLFFRVVNILSGSLLIILGLVLAASAAGLFG